MHELRRGSTPSTITHLSFDKESTYLSCCSAKAKIHLFKTSLDSSQSAGNTKSYFAALSTFVSFAGSEWSFAQFELAADEVSENSRAVIN